MKRYGRLISLVVLGFGYFSAWAQYGTSIKIGDTTFYSLSDKDAGFISGTSTRIGDTTFHSFSSTRGGSVHGTSNDIDDDITLHDFSIRGGGGVSGTTMRIGDTAFHDLRASDGRSISGTSTRIGSMVFHDLTTHQGFNASREPRRKSESVGISMDDPSPSIWKRKTDEQEENEENDEDIRSLSYWELRKPLKTREQTETGAKKTLRPYDSLLDEANAASLTGRLSVQNNPLGGYRLRDDRGNSWEVKKHPLGGYRVTDEEGNTYRARKNALGKFDIEKE